MKGTLVSTSILFALLPLFIMVPVLLIVAIPVVAAGSWGLMRTPKPKPVTLDDWWEDNWRRFL